jgi:glutathione S-transferase
MAQSLLAPRALVSTRFTPCTMKPNRRRAAVSVRAGGDPPSIYGSPGSRTQIVEWLALEVGQDIKNVNLNRAIMSSPEYRSVHPFGKIPGCKAADGTGIFESGAIMLYIADLAGSLPTPEARGEAAAWVIWANATMWPALEASRGKCNLDNVFGPIRRGSWARSSPSPTSPSRRTSSTASCSFAWTSARFPTWSGTWNRLSRGRRSSRPSWEVKRTAGVRRESDY